MLGILEAVQLCTRALWKVNENILMEYSPSCVLGVFTLLQQQSALSPKVVCNRPYGKVVNNPLVLAWSYRVILTQMDY